MVRLQDGLVKGDDGVVRCWWSAATPLYGRYHDVEWGQPVVNDHRLFEKICLEGFQAGLSWLTILKKRQNFRKAFRNFDPKKVARFDSLKVRRLMKDKGIIRNRLKIKAAIQNARIFLQVQKEFGSFNKYLWQFVGYKPRTNRWKSLKEIPAKTKESDIMSEDLKKWGFRFVGSTICYANMQATGMVNDHLLSCFRYKEVSP